MKKYNQLTAMFAITKGSLSALMRSPSAIIFTFLFPFIFILIFGFIGGNSSLPIYKVVIDKQADTSNALFAAIKESGFIKFVKYDSEIEQKKAFEKGKFVAVLNIRKSNSSSPEYIYSIKSSSVVNQKWPQLLGMLQNISNEVSNKKYSNRPSFANADFNPVRDVEHVREHRTIDFILPGQLGFSLLSAGVFGVAFTFFGLRNTLVLKRFFATPIKRAYIVLGEAFSRVTFQMITAIVIITVGHFFFNFTLINGISTVLQMLFLSFIGLLVFMGFGFAISGMVKSDSSIAPFANLITLPQFLIGGTFFDISLFPNWLQSVAKVLPMTHLNIALREVAFEGLSLWDVKLEIGILLLWGLLVYAVAIKVFRWE